MDYTKYVYQRVNWKNKSDSLETPLGKTNLNRMDSAIYNIAENLDIVYNKMSTEKFDKQDANKVICGMPTWDSQTGVLSFRFYDGTEFVVDFNIEKIPVSFSMDSSGVITMITSDGEQWTADIGDIIPDYVFHDSERIVFSRTKSEDGSYSISADIIKGSITDEYLEPSYLSNITEQASKSEESANLSREYSDNSSYDAKLSQSYAVGGSGIRENESTDNAKYYYQQAKSTDVGQLRQDVDEIKNDLSNLLVELEVPIAGTKINNYYSEVKTNIDNTKYYPISIEDTDGNWDQFCIYSIGERGASIFIKCTKESYIIPSSIKPLRVICMRIL